MAPSKTPIAPPDGSTYTLRKGGKICVTSSIPDLGYSSQELRQLKAAGYELYIDGKKAKKSK